MRLLDERVSTKARPKNYTPVHKCMNCGSELVEPVGGIDARRFCSTKCKEDYVNPK